MREYAQARREPGQVVTLVVAGLFVLAAALDVGPGMVDNLMHLTFGLTGFAFSRGPRAARAFLIGGGVTYFLLWQFGAVVDPGLIPFHTANVGVHLSLVASMIVLAVLSGGGAEAPAVAREAEYVRDVYDFARPRPSRNRPPSRGDRRTPRMAAAGRPPAGFACRA
jgi:hypothetical protein